MVSVITQHSTSISARTIMLGHERREEDECDSHMMKVRSSVHHNPSAHSLVKSRSSVESSQIFIRTLSEHQEYYLKHAQCCFLHRSQNHRLFPAALRTNCWMWRLFPLSPLSCLLSPAHTPPLTSCRRAHIHDITSNIPNSPMKLLSTS